jgi:glycosyltransferase involved in cell wall biosynthesis
MKILWVKAGGLVPPDSGGKIRSYNILRELARSHSVTFFSFHAALENDPHPNLGEIFDRVVCVPLKLPPPKSLAELRDYTVRLVSPLPYGITKFCRNVVSRKLSDLIRQEKFDMVLCDFIAPVGVVPWGAPLPKVIFTHNVEAMIWKRHYEVAENALWRAISWWEWRKMEAAETKYLRLADRVLTVSETDRDTFTPFLPGKTITVIPTGVDIEYFQPMSLQESPKSLVFTGSMDWLPNEDGILYFVDEVLPLLKLRYPEVSLNAVGRNPSRKLQALADKEQALRLTGWVGDIRPHLARSAICIVPLRIGGGTRLKIFEAMAMGKATVSTSVGAEGLPVQNGTNILLADTPTDFADAISRLFDDIPLRQRLGEAARTLVSENYSWRKIAESFSNSLADVKETYERSRRNGLKQ